MGQNVLLKYDDLLRELGRAEAPTPRDEVCAEPAPLVESEPKPLPNTGGVPRAILMAFTALFAVLLVSLSAPAMGAAPMPLVFAICVICFAGYFGGGLLSPVVRESLMWNRGEIVATGSGPLSAREAAWQILPLPALLAAFGIFAAVLKAAMF